MGRYSIFHFGWERPHPKPHGAYRAYLHPSVEALYHECAPWPSSRSKKRDAMMEELKRLHQERVSVLDPQYCVFQLWDGDKLIPCGKLEDGRVHSNPLCAEHLIYARGMPEDSFHVNEPKPYIYARLRREWYKTFGHSGKTGKRRMKL